MGQYQPLKGEKWPFRSFRLFQTGRKNNHSIPYTFGGWIQNFGILSFVTNECRTRGSWYIESSEKGLGAKVPGFGPPMEGAVTREGRTRWRDDVDDDDDDDDDADAGDDDDDAL